MTTPTDTLEQSWWPELQVSPNAIGERAASAIKLRFLGATQRGATSSTATLHKKHKDDWRVIVMRKRIGRGQACYEKVRDAALDWEFQSADGSMGMLEVPATCPPGAKQKHYNVQQQQQQNLAKPFRSSSRYTVQPVDVEDAQSTGYRSLGSSSRRLVSFSSKALAGFLPEGLKKRLYAVNPVMVVYDLIDQRAPGTTFTSTAYATLKGHWLSGEERVSVALRDGTQYVDIEILSVSRAGPSLWGKAVWPFVGKMQSNFFQEHLKHLEDVAKSCENATENDGTDGVSIPWSLPPQQSKANRKTSAPSASSRIIPAFSSPMSSRDPFLRDDEVTVAFENGAI